MRHPLMPQTPVCTVRADTPIGECSRILRDRSLGALVVLSDDAKEEIVGIFTERDLVKHIELIHRGGFWDTPVRTVMTASVRTVKVEELDLVPRLMAEHHIRHVPVVSFEAGKTRVVGVISMRDIFRIVMEQLHFDLGKVFHPPTVPKAAGGLKVVAVLSEDKAVVELLEKGARLTRHFIASAVAANAPSLRLAELFVKFQAVLIDLDGLPELQAEKYLAEARATGLARHLYFAFTPPRLPQKLLDELHRLADQGSARLLAKPLAIGMLYEKLLKEV